MHFTGKYGVDLLAHFITPGAPAITSGEWGVMKHISALQTCARDWRVFVAPLKPGQTFTVSSAEAGRVVTVATPEYTDTILLAHFPFHYADSALTFAGRAGVVRRTADGHCEHALLDGEVLEIDN